MTQKFRPSIFLFFISLIIFACTNQKGIYSKVPFNRVTLVKSDTLFQFYTKPVDVKMLSKISDSKYYTWFKADSIFETRGAYSGKLLDEDYLELYPNRALKQKGQYDYGLKTGKWETWYQNGERESVITWDKGLKDGKFEWYDASGKLLKSGNYKAGKEEGIFSDILPGGRTHQITYKQGAIISDTIFKKM
ncbi:MAG: hypothetical protein JST86_00200 [Bacteroidetes bacterium]|nr:hypothetical protein [Bacteroidota bacterium]